MRRLLGAVSFAILGFISLWLWVGIDEKICEHFPKLCIRHGCHELGKCPIDFWQGLVFLVIVFGPPVVFAVSAAIFSRQRRSWLGWSSLLCGLVALHWTTMLIDRVI